MFSGIIEKLGRVESVERRGGSLALVLETGYERLEPGESVAVNGACLTVTAFSRGQASFFVSPATLACTHLGRLAAGDVVNLERAVCLGTRLSGHLVQGHVDGAAVLTSITAESGAHRLELTLPDTLARYCVEKGSIALDGISLTINTITPAVPGQSRISVVIIPHTWEHTNLHAARIGDKLNVEVDVIAKYVERLCQPFPKP